MKKVIRLKESDLKNIIKRVLKEQSVVGAPNYGTIQLHPTKETTFYGCVPGNLSLFVDYVMSNKKLLMKKLNLDSKNLILLTKASLGIIGRESKFGNYTEGWDTFSETLRGIGLGSLVDWGLKKNMEIVNKVQVLDNLLKILGKTYGLDKSIGDYNSSFNVINQGLGVLYTLSNRYKRALSNGLKTEPSVNPILSKYGLIGKIKGTGNHALDMAILSHNMPEEKTLYTYCTTNHPLYAGPCNKSKVNPYKTKEAFNPKSKILMKVTDPNLKKFPGELTVNQSGVISNYFPNLGGPGHSGLGYVEEVATFMKSFNCF